jgi:hypothetical protein
MKDNVSILDHMISKYHSYPCGALYCAFIDFEKAFDIVNWQKLENERISGNYRHHAQQTDHAGCIHAVFRTNY